MARPRIEGLKYFPMDVEFDAKFRAMELHFGNDFFVWIVKFWQEAYKSKNGVVDLSGILGVLQAENSRITPGKQAEIIRDCLDIGLLQQPEPEKYTSNGIQKRINQVNSDREKSRKRKENKLFAGKPPENSRTTGEKEREREKEREKESIKKTYADKFEDFWGAYPKRNGKKVGKQAAQRKFEKIPVADLDRVIANARNYGINNDYPKDPERFLKDDFWKDWETPQQPKQIGQKYGRQEVSNEALKRMMEVELE